MPSSLAASGKRGLLGHMATRVPLVEFRLAHRLGTPSHVKVAGQRLLHPAEIPRNIDIEQQRVNDERQRTRPRRSGRVCAGRWRVVNSLTRKRSEVQILVRPQLFWLLRGQVWLLTRASPMIPRGIAKIPRDAFHSLPRKITRTDVWQLSRSTDVKRFTRSETSCRTWSRWEEGGGFPGMVYSLLAIVHYLMNEVPE